MRFSRERQFYLLYRALLYRKLTVLNYSASRQEKATLCASKRTNFAVLYKISPVQVPTGHCKFPSLKAKAVVVAASILEGSVVGMRENGQVLVSAQ